MKSYASNEIQQSTIDVLADDIKQIIELHKSDEMTAMTYLNAIHTVLSNYDQMIKIQEYINANGGKLPLGVGQAVDHAALIAGNGGKPLNTVTVSAAKKSNTSKK